MGGEFALAGASGAEGVGEGEEFVELGIPAGGGGGAGDERFERLATHFALGIGPDEDVALGVEDGVFEGRRGVGGGKTAGEGADFRGPDVGKAVDEEVEEVALAEDVAAVFEKQEIGFGDALEGGVNVGERDAQLEGERDKGHARPWMSTELEGDDDVLGAERHGWF
jgi:hypothetical protein